MPVPIREDGMVRRQWTGMKLLGKNVGAGDPRKDRLHQFRLLSSGSSTGIAIGGETGSLGTAGFVFLRILTRFTRPSKTHPLTAGTQGFFRK